jgi:lysophospholipase L1-like esterase
MSCPIVVAGTFFLLGSVVAAAEVAYLRPGEVVVCVGDSVTAAGVYDSFLQAMLDRMYPEAGIRIVNRGQGGQTASAAVNLLRSAIDTEHPTLATFMFGVNDTRWSAGDEEAKAAAFVAGLTTAVDLAAANDIAPLLLRESHFSHGQAPDEFATTVNGVFDRLMAAQDAFAATRGVPVIDTLGAYKRGLAAAWSADPRYEFSPDIVHPNSAGHAALAGELLRAFGAGLPLASGGDRGPLRIAPADDMSIEFAAASGVLPPGASLPVEVTLHNRSATTMQGTLRYLKPGAALPPDPAKADNWVEVRFPPRQSGWRLATVAGESQAFLCTTTYSWDEWHPFRFLRLMKPRLHNIVPEAIANGEAEYTSYGDLRPPEYFKASFIVTGEGSWQSHGPDRDGRTPRPPVTDIDPTWFVVSWDEPTTSTSISMTNSPPKSPFPHGPHNHSQRTVMNLSRFTCLPTMKISR